jgi:FKBP-type peptidyl-prolyl cis-trans isomerase 2
VHVRYSGKLAETGKVFDTNLENPEPITYELGKGLVINGWERGLVGTCPGERLELTIPPELGYGAEGKLISISCNHKELNASKNLLSTQKLIRNRFLRAHSSLGLPCGNTSQFPASDP